MSETSVPIDLIDKLFAFRKDRPRIFKDAMGITKDCEVLAKIYDNIPLFRVYYGSECTRYKSADDALYDLQQDSILMYFADIDLYGMFTPDNYTSFCSSIREKKADYDFEVDIYQLVLAEHKQKLVFLCTDEKYYDKMKTYAEACFGTTTHRLQKEITVNIPCNGNEDIISAYDKLYNYICDHGDQQCGEAMKQFQPRKTRYYSYRKYKCSDTLDVRTVEALVELLRSMTINAPIIIGNNNTMKNISVINTPTDKKQPTIEWIKDNPPHDKEITTDYYTRYTSDVDYPIANNQFGKLVRAEGYSTVRTTSNTRYWKK